MFKKMKKIISDLYSADIAYYKYDQPIMTDRDYDKLYDQLLSLEKESGVVLSGSPTRKVSGDILEELTQANHSKPMLSAKKTKAIEDVVKFAAAQPVVVTWKLDGLTLVLRYKKGRFQKAITRGREGLVGEDVSHTVRVMMNVPMEIPYEEDLEVRGEGVISWSNFEKINAEIDLEEDDSYTHPRNLAAGSIRRLDARKSKTQYLEFLAFDIVDSSMDKSEQLGFLAEIGFDVVGYTLVNSDSTGKQLQEVIETSNPRGYTYPVDGLIIEYENTEYGQSLGATGHHENRLIAFKWEDTLYETKFLGLELATTRTGMVSITGIFEDVEIDGTKINRAYLHNLDIMDSFHLGIGDTVKIYKANQIIPQLAENITKSGTLKLPTSCPCCGETLIIQKSSNGTRYLYCENPVCIAKWVQKIVHFCDKTRMDITGLSQKILERLVANGWIKDFGDLYRLDRYRTEFINSPGFGEKLFDRLQASIEESRHCALNQFISGLGIPMVGRSAARTLNTHFQGDWNQFEKAIQEQYDFTQLPDFGQIMHDNIYAWYADDAAAKLWRPVLDQITFQEMVSEIKTIDNPFVDKIIVASGKLENYSRDGIQEKLIELGAKPTNAVSKKTDYLIVGEGAGSKLSKAQELGIPTLSETQFEDMLIGVAVT